MAKLIVNPTSSSRREIPLPKSLLSIGRDPSNDLVLPDAMVSRRHAVIEFRGSQYFLRDCNSSNGSLVNGDRVSERNLRDGDLVAIGTARLLFREDAELEELGAKVVQHPSSPRLQCPSCHADYRKGDQFCRQCGAPIAPSAPAKVVCTSCGTAVPLPARFCNACGSPLRPKEEGLDATKPRPRPLGGEPDPPEHDVQAPRPEDSSSRGDPDSGTSASDRSEPAPPVDSPRSSRSAAVVEPAPPHPRPIADAPPRPIPLPPRIPVLHDRPRPVLPQHDPAGPEVGLKPRADAPAPAGFPRRLAAATVDAAVVLLGQTVLLAPVLLYWWSRELPTRPQDVPYTPIFLSLTLLVLAAVLGAGYYVYFWGVRGATPGKQLFGLVVVGEDGVFPIGAPKALARLLGYLLSAATLGIGFLMIAAGGVGLHDRVAATRVVERDAR